MVRTAAIRAALGALAAAAIVLTGAGIATAGPYSPGIDTGQHAPLDRSPETTSPGLDTGQHAPLDHSPYPHYYTSGYPSNPDDQAYCDRLTADANAWVDRGDQAKADYLASFGNSVGCSIH